MTTDQDFPDTMVMPRRQTMPFEPASYRAAMCKADACAQGDKLCPTPDACRLPDGVVGARIGALVFLASAVAVIAAIVGAVRWLFF